MSGFCFASTSRERAERASGKCEASLVWRRVGQRGPRLAVALAVSGAGTDASARRELRGARRAVRRAVESRGALGVAGRPAQGAAARAREERWRGLHREQRRGLGRSGGVGAAAAASPAGVLQRLPRQQRRGGGMGSEHAQHEGAAAARCMGQLWRPRAASCGGRHALAARQVTHGAAEGTSTDWKQRPWGISSRRKKQKRGIRKNY
ncbi:hypothetical protein PVAP13_2KG331268 [Panicum virgatum]|uniref:Uncharacterized protein n=1 Tax=Panicum virgatum TaxID=38727 RepID=A0A8T0W1A9_PANVG|nr:hypothetical protein PVAP13_2KG331268 [Panicum virgatum]